MSYLGPATCTCNNGTAENRSLSLSPRFLQRVNISMRWRHATNNEQFQRDICARSHGHYVVYDFLVSHSTSPLCTLSILLIPFDQN